jgi:gamma-glutamyl-gamma-aminobutyrate hydrolase PuuD
MSKNVLGHVGMGTGEFEPFNQSYRSGLLVTPDDILAGKVDGLVIWGGADISPSIYNEPVGPHTGASEQLSYRDRKEVAAVEAAIKVGIPLIGVCRGAQLMCAMAGGKLVQDVQGHFGSHDMLTSDGRTIRTTSVHHQMMYPFLLPDDEYDLLAWAAPARSTTYVGMDPERMKDFDGNIIEPEVVYFHKINALAIQGHPEFVRDPQDPFVVYCNDLVKEYL